MDLTWIHPESSNTSSSLPNLALSTSLNDLERIPSDYIRVILRPTCIKYINIVTRRVLIFEYAQIL
jgi:hypothetical protein